jgi:hypothetical protein
LIDHEIQYLEGDKRAISACVPTRVYASYPRSERAILRPSAGFVQDVRCSWVLYAPWNASRDRSASPVKPINGSRLFWNTRCFGWVYHMWEAGILLGLLLPNARSCCRSWLVVTLSLGGLSLLRPFGACWPLPGLPSFGADRPDRPDRPDTMDHHRSILEKGVVRRPVNTAS